MTNAQDQTRHRPRVRVFKGAAEATGSANGIRSTPITLPAFDSDELNLDVFGTLAAQDNEKDAPEPVPDTSRESRVANAMASLPSKVTTQELLHSTQIAQGFPRGITASTLRKILSRMKDQGQVSAEMRFVPNDHGGARTAYWSLTSAAQMGAGMNITTEQKRASIERELTMRRRVYPRWVETGKITRQKAEREIAIMEAILEDYPSKQEQLL